MKKILSLFFLLPSLFACVSIEFENPQPKKGKTLSEFPEVMQGSYLIKIIGNEDEVSDDTLVIKDKYYFETKNQKRVFISDSCILTKLDEQIIINLKKSSERYWQVGLIDVIENNNLMINSLIGEVKNEDIFISNINNLTPVNRFQKSENNYGYSISPSKRELKLIVKSGYFKPVYQLIRVQ